MVAVAVSVGPPAPPAKAIRFERAQTQSQAEKDMMDRQLHEANKKRQQDIRNDTDKLFQLATELKAAVDKTNENLLSLEVVRKADEVEKLAKRVKEKMRDSVVRLRNSLRLRSSDLHNREARGAMLRSHET